VTRRVIRAVVSVRQYELEDDNAQASDEKLNEMDKNAEYKSIMDNTLIEYPEDVKMQSDVEGRAPEDRDNDGSDRDSEESKLVSRNPDNDPEKTPGAQTDTKLPDDKSRRGSGRR